jgi:pilus assembly protein CpaC
MRRPIGALAALVAAALSLGALLLAGPSEARIYRLNPDAGMGRLTVAVNHSETLRLDGPFTEITVAQPEIANVIPMSDRTVYVLGKAIGTTNISFFDKDKQLIGVIDLEIAHDVNSLNQKLKKAMPSAKIDVSSSNGKVLLTGRVMDAVQLDRALRIGEQFAPEAVTNGLMVGTDQQVLLEVRILEASRSAGRDLGVDWSVLSKRVNAFTGTAISGASPLLSGQVPFGSLLGSLLNGGTDIDVLIRALEQKNLVRRLAEPNLVALSGDTASFLAGGEIPVPTGRDNDGNVVFQFKRFGVSLAFTPTVLDKAKVNLKIEPEVSEVDPSLTFNFGTITIPGFIVRTAKTTVELRDGQSFAIAGLLQSNHNKAQEQIPWLGQVPILGALFRSASYQKNETDLVIIITPRIVRPNTPGMKLASPLENSTPTNDPEFFLTGQQELPKKKTRALDPAVDRGPYGHILDVNVSNTNIGFGK